TFPYALTEGAIHKCATIASRVGGIPALISNGVNGYLFPAQDVDALSEAMTDLALSPETRSRFAQALFERVRDQFSVQATVSRQREIYGIILRRARRPKQKRDGVVICGAYGKDNAGDDAILETIIAQLQALDPDLPLCVLSRKPILTRQRYRIDAVQTFNLFGFLRRMRKSRLYLSGGGTLIQDATSSRSLLYYLFNIYCAKKTGNRVLMYGCGIGPVSGTFNRRIAGKVIDRYSDIITLREDSSAKELSEMGVTHPEIRITADPALLLSPASRTDVDSFLISQGIDPKGRYCLFSLRPWQGFAEKAEAFAACAQAVSEMGLTPLFFHLEPGRDQQAAELVAAHLTCPYRMLSVPSSGALTVGVIQRAEVVVSMRLHALIFATGQGVPVVGVVYDPKVRAYMDYLGEHQYLDLSDVSEEALISLVRTSLARINPPDATGLCRLARENLTAAASLLGLPMPSAEENA
ncbi:MAG: polysaccharide pyruvyl transferase CsaB, partial [Oscillospiraceae bacterium]|nr:polysaccharide pyruvyl transferase CsaB [Oscillospiraceae bacterium]